MAIDFTASDENKLSERERLMLQQERQRDFEHQRYMAAQQRAFDRNVAFAMKHPNAINDNERKLYLGDRAQKQSWAHEIQMLRQQGENDFRVAEQRRMGMENQGMGAAEANGRWGLEIEKQRGASALTLEERRLAGQKDLAEIDARARENIARTGLESEKYKADMSHKSVVDTNDANFDIEVERGKNAAEIARENRIAAAAAKEEAQQERLQAADNKNNQAQEERIRKTIHDLRMQPGGNNLSDEELRSKAMRQLGIAGGRLSQFRK